MSKKSSDRTLKIVIAAMFSAMIAVLTAFIKIPTPTGGYVHLGDTCVYLCACFLPMPYSILACAIGGGIADLLVYPETIIFTIIIKSLNSLFFSSKDEKILIKRNKLMIIPSGLVTVIGYSISKFIRDLLIGTDMLTALFDALYKIPENFIQATASGLMFLLIAYAFDKADIKQRMLRGRN